MRVILFLGVAAHLALAGCQPAVTPRLNGGGSSFVFPMMIKWSRVYFEQTGIQIDYSSAGSGNGQRQMLARVIEFGCTDAVISDKLLEEAARDPNGGPVLHIPLLLGAVVPVYNLPGVQKTLHFTGPVLAEIFLGEIKHWNDPRIAALNPGVSLPDQPILVVSRADSSGTTAVWVDYLAKVHPRIKPEVGQGTNASFVVGIRERGNERVAGKVYDRPGAIGYVELLYALQSELAYGAVQNRAGQFVKADLKSVTAAAAEVLDQIPDDLRFSLTDAAGDDSYPISGAVWAICFEKQPPEIAELLYNFFRWAVHEGQTHAAALNYAPLPQGLVERIDVNLQRLQLPMREKRP